MNIQNVVEIQDHIHCCPPSLTGSPVAADDTIHLAHTLFNMFDDAEHDAPEKNY